MTKKEDAEEMIDVLIAEAIIQVRALESLLIAKGIVTKEEVDAEMFLITSQVSKKILEKAQVAGDLDAILKSFDKDKN